MNSLVRWLSFGAVVGLTALGCSSSSETALSDLASSRNVVASNVTVADADFVRDVVVSEGTLVLPRKGHEELVDTLTPGTVLVGDRVADSSTNPYGFVRRVERVRLDGNSIVIDTSPAGIGDVFERASLRLSLDGESAASPSAPKTRNIDARAPRWSGGYGFEGGAVAWDRPLNAGGASGNVKLVLSDVHAHVDPHATIRVEKGALGAITKIDADLDVPYEAGLQLCGEVRFDGSKTIADAAPLTKTLFDQPLYTMTVMVGVVPIVASVRAKVDATCKVQHAASVTLKGSYQVHGAPRLTVGDVDADDSGLRAEAFQSTGQIEVDAEGSFGVRCDLGVKLGVYLYDMLGVHGAVRPAVDFTVSGGAADTAAEGTRASACASLTANIDTEVGVQASAFGHSLFEKTSVPWQSGPIDVYSSCAGRDSCEGRGPGWYCSELADYGAIQCDENGTIVSGYQCGNEAPYCQRSGAARTDKALMDGATPRCGTTRPEVKRSPATLTCPAVTTE